MLGADEVIGASKDKELPMGNVFSAQAATFAAGTIVALTIAAAPAGASYQGDTKPPPVIVPTDCLTILIRVDQLNEMVDALNDAANDAWSAWRGVSTSNEEMLDTIRGLESAATQVNEAYGQARDAWVLKGCKGNLPPLNNFDYPWRELGI